MIGAHRWERTFETDTTSTHEPTATDSPKSAVRKTLEAGILSLVLMGFSLPRSLPLLQAGLFSDTDDAARLVQVRDLVGGQAWFDLSQHRLGVGGAPMHWTRLWDAFLALPILTLRSSVGDAAAEVIAVTVAPTIVLLAVLLLAGKIATDLAGEGAWLPAVVTALIVPFTTTRLVPGAIDDHGFQVMLVLLMLAGLIDRRPRWLATAGIAGGLSLVVGVDTVPIIAAVFVAIGWHWASGGNSAAALRRFPAWLLASTIAGALLFGPASRLVGRSCQVVSLPYVVALAGTAATFWLLLPRSFNTLKTRLGLLTIGGIVTIGVAALVAPACLQGVYADLPREANESWLQYVAELQPLDLGAGNRVLHIGILLAPLIALAIVGIKVKRDYEWKWLLLTATSATALGLGVWQQREAGSAALLAAPACGAAIWIVAGRLKPAPLRSIAVTLSPIIVSGTLLVFVGSQAPAALATGDAPPPCRASVVVDQLASLDRSVVVSDVDFGATLLVRTEHQVVAAPYHLNADGIVLAHHIFTSSEAEAARLARRNGVDLIVDCRSAPLLRIWEGEGGLLADLRLGRVPAWLAIVIDEPGATAYRVLTD